MQQKSDKYRYYLNTANPGKLIVGCAFIFYLLSFFYIENTRLAYADKKVVQHQVELQSVVGVKLLNYCKKVKKRYRGSTLLGVSLVRLNDGAKVFSFNDSKLMIPASTFKLLTSIAALRYLGADYRFPSEIFVDHLPQEKTKVLGRAGSVGRIYLRGYGDPDLTQENLWKMARKIRSFGISRVTDVVIDDTLFTGAKKPSGPRPYQAGSSAGSFNHNSYAIHVSPTRIGKYAFVTSSPGINAKVENRVRTIGGHVANIVIEQSPRNTQFDVAKVTKQEDSFLRFKIPITKLSLKGTIGINSDVFTTYRAVPVPSAYLGFAFKELLLENGIKVGGNVLLGETPSSAKLLEVFHSRPLGELLIGLNHFSNNFIAQQLLFALGQDNVGYFDLDIAHRRLEQLLILLGVKETDFVVKDGAGLSRGNRLTPAAMTKVLLAAYKDFSVSPVLISSLSRFGLSGTLKKRFLGASKERHLGQPGGRVWAKTGTLNGVSSLAGFLENNKGERFAFAVFINGKIASGKAKQLEDNIVKLVMEN